MVVPRAAQHQRLFALMTTFQPQQPPSSSARRAAPAPQASDEVLQKNLNALMVHSPNAAKAILQAQESPAWSFVETQDGLGSAECTVQGRVVAMASKRRPGDEAERFAATYNLTGAPVVVMVGFGVGHHARMVAGRVEGSGMVMLFEPDVQALRWVLSRFDHSDWLGMPWVRLVIDENDRGGLAVALRGAESLGMMGIQLLEHMPSKARLGGRGGVFAETLTGVLRSVRTTVATTLVQSGISLRNELMNLAAYDSVEGIAPLKGIAQGSPAIVVSAGPSLARNIDLLRDPAVRERVVIIAVQTVLKPLLEKGIRPHFVTALDHHEISKRFYEGLTESDVEGVTLVAEPKSNSAIVDTFPGGIRCPGASNLDEILGIPPDPNGELPKGQIRSGGTVAHLAYYLARYLGCDPVALIGQDLAFTDGQYYAPNAAIHKVWGPELGEFRTLEMFEWERISRMRRTLYRVKDHLGRPVYSDEQMQTYLTQFEREFVQDADRGYITIDATEGGVAKRGTTIRTLAECLNEWRDKPVLDIPEASRPKPASKKLREKVREVRQSAWRVVKASREAADLLGKMLDNLDDDAKVNELIGKVHHVRGRVHKENPAFELINRINQVAVFNRYKADRLMSVENLEGKALQRAQVERDQKNVIWTGDAGEELCRLLDAAVGALDGGPKLTRNDQTNEGTRANGADKKKIWAFVPVLERSGLNTERDLGQEIVDGRNALSLTIERIGSSERISGIALVGPDTEQIRTLLGDAEKKSGKPIRIIECDREAMLDRVRSVGVSRAFAPGSWRGGPGGLTAYDELLHFAALHDACEGVGADAMIMVGPDWCLVDPDLLDQCAERYEANPERHRLCFVQGTPGLGGCLVANDLIESFNKNGLLSGVMGTVGGLLGYHPALKQGDPIAQSGCVTPDTIVRSLNARLIADSGTTIELIREVISKAGTDADCTAAAGAVRDIFEADQPTEHITIDIGGENAWIGADEVAGFAGDQFRPGFTAITLRSGDDAAKHPELGSLIRACKDLGATGVHVRTSLVDETDAIKQLINAGEGPDIISADMLADDELTYSQVTGRDDYHRARKSLLRMIQGRDVVGGLAFPWIAPRITRRDAVYEQIESFYDEWIRTAGTCVIDPLPAPIEGERISPLPVPDEVRDRLEAGETVMQAISIGEAA